MARTAYSYIRFSHPKQLKGNSLARQKEASAAFAQRHGWNLDASLVLEDKGKSGFKHRQKREGLKAFLTAIKDGIVEPGSVLIIEHLDRLSREKLRPALKLFIDIIESGVDIAVLQPSERVYTAANTNDITGLMEPLIYFSLANDESEKKSFRAYDNWKRKRALARENGTPATTKVPAWLSVQNGKFILDEDKAEVIRQIFQWSIDGDGARVITKRLNQEGIANVALGRVSTAKVRWTLNYVEQMLGDRKLLGEFQPRMFDTDGNRVPDGDLIPEYFPRVIDDDLFYASAAARQSRTKQQGRRGEGIANLFTGILFDARSGSSMRIVNSSAAEKKAGTYRRLASYHADLGGESFHSWKYENFEEFFLQFVREISANDLLPSKKGRSRMPALQGKLREINRRIEELTAELVSAPDFKVLLEALKRLEIERSGVEAEIESEKKRHNSTSSAAPADLIHILDLLDSAEGEERMRLRTKLKAVIRLVVKEIWVLIEERRDEEKYTRTCTVQVFFANDTFRQYMIVRDKRKFFAVGQRTPMSGGPMPTLDLRKWRERAKK